jgi:hypothetical protein
LVVLAYQLVARHSQSELTRQTLHLATAILMELMALTPQQSVLFMLVAQTTLTSQIAQLTLAAPMVFTLARQ